MSFGSGTAEIEDPIIIDVRFNFALEIRFVLDKTGDDQLHTGLLSYLDAFLCPFFPVDATEEEQVITRIGFEGKQVEIDAVMDSSNVLKFRALVRFADSHIVSTAVVLLIHWQNFWR